ncbi:hypothetical protein HYALB_00003308 [Hymenoscyphus albidus]|uniref:GAR domain-containing protein n=1 Tax=Hymenoscyphus albidus TaxID=595503 RepID=A0A9N9PXQ3_9HELO|nr:hypothetical protein HYALB_00003308 [Hymenoscyphus albidus]
MEIPSLLSPTSSGSHLYRSHSRSASRSPTRERITDDILADLSPSSTHAAFANPSGKLKASIEAATTSERQFGIRATLASKKIQEWVEELSSWPWPKAGGSVGFQMPAAKRRKTLDNYSERRESTIILDRHGTRDVEDPEYMGSLLADDVDRYEVRVEEIIEDMEALDVESIKRRILDTHFSAWSRPSSSASNAPMPSQFSSYTMMDDFTAIVTATVLQALPNLSKLMRLLSIWSIRLAVLTKVPPLLWSLDITEQALNSAWAVLEAAYRGGPDQVLTREIFEIMKNSLRDRVTELGRNLDYMLDTLEGREDTLPDAWLDRMEVIEDDYGKWVVSVDRHIRQVEWEKMAREIKAVGEARRAAEMQAAEEARKQAEIAAEEAAKVQEEKDSQDALEAQRQQELDQEVSRAADEQRENSKPEDVQKVGSQMFSESIQNVNVEKVLDVAGDVPLATDEMVAAGVQHRKTSQDIHDMDSFIENDSELRGSPSRETPKKNSTENSFEDIPQPLIDHPAVSREIDFELAVRPSTAITHLTGSDSLPSFESPARHVPSSPRTMGLQAPDSTDLNEVWSLVDTYKERHQLDRSKSSSSASSRASAKAARASKRHSRNVSSFAPSVSPSAIEQSGGKSPRMEPTSTLADNGGLQVVGLDKAFKFPPSRAEEESFDSSQLSSESFTPDDFDTSGDQIKSSLMELSIPRISNTAPTPRRPSAIRPNTMRHASNVSDTETIIAEWGDGPSSPTNMSTPVVDEVDRFSGGGEQSPTAGRLRLRPLDMYDNSPPDSPQSVIASPKRRSIPSPTSSTYSVSDISDTSSISFDAPIFEEVEVSEALPFSKPRNRSDDKLQRQISSLLEKLPAKICLTSEPDAHTTNTLRMKKTRRSVTPSIRPSSSMSSRAPTPSFLLSPAYSKTPARTRPQSPNPEIKMYHLSRSTGEAPIKLFVRLVGENGERVMVRVGGGWADLGEYLKEYASHHGRRTTVDSDKIEVQDLTPRVVSASSTTSTATIRGADGGRSSPAPQDFPRSVSSLGVRKARRSLGESSLHARRDFRSPSTPLPMPPRLAQGDTPPSTTINARSSSRVGWTNDDSSLGLAGPVGKKVVISEKDQEWVDSMTEKVKQASAEKDREKERERRIKARERGASFGEMGKIGGTKRLFRKA